MLIKKCDCAKGKGAIPGQCKICHGTGTLRVVNSRSKGNKFERDIAKLLTSWSDISMKRTPMSGGWSKTGDITPVKPEDMVKWPFNVELKKRENWNLVDLITGNNIKTSIISWWEQCLSDSSKSGKIPMLIFTKNLDINYCVINNTTIFSTIIKQNPNINHLIYVSEKHTFTIFDLDKLLEIEFEEVLRWM